MTTTTINAARLDHECARRGLTARRLAELSGLTEAAISRLKRGHTRARPSTIAAIAEALTATPVLPGADLIL